MRAKLICVFITADSRVNIWSVKLIQAPKPPVASAAVRSKAVVLLMVIHVWCRF